jgi:hypothetical protein
MSRLMIKPVQTRPNEQPDVTHGLLSGTADPQVWSKAIDLLARNILLREPGKELDQERELALSLETANWIAPQDRPIQIARKAGWGWAARPGNWVDLRLGLDIYNGSDQPLEGELEWVSAPRGWEISPQPIAIEQVNAVSVYQVKPFTMEAWVDLSRLGPETRKPIQLKFVDKNRRRASHLTVLAPVAACDKREGRLAIDGALGDWDDAADAIHLGPLAVMLDRPNLQKQAMQMASTHSSIYANWAAKQFYVAFKLDGVSPPDGRANKNTVDYQLRRAWGEDLCEILIQPVYVRGDAGHVVHLVCKANGQVVVSTKPSPKNQKLFGTDYKPVVGTAAHLEAKIEGSVWRGEIAIPWELIHDKDHKGMNPPTLLRFNFVQHKQSTGESSSWAGPIDFGQDDSFMGLLHLRDVKAPGMGTRE